MLEYLNLGEFLYHAKIFEERALSNGKQYLWNSGTFVLGEYSR